MKSKAINGGVERVFVFILDQGEEAFESITEFANREGLGDRRFKRRSAGSILPPRRSSREDNEQCEVLSLLGDVAQGDDSKAGLRDGMLRGADPLSGSVQPTFEVTITETVVHPRRKKRPDLVIALISIVVEATCAHFLKAKDKSVTRSRRKRRSGRRP